MKKYLGILLCVLLLAVLYSVAYAEWEGYMIINPDRNLFTDDKLSGIMGHFEEQSIVYAKNKGGINMYEVLFTTIGEVGGTEYTKAYVVIAEPKVLSAAKAAEYRQILESRGAHKVDGIPLPSAEVNPEPAERPDKYGTIQMSGTAVIKVSETNIRKGPDRNENTYGIYTKNTELPVYGYVDKNGTVWYKVREPENNNIGFIMSDYVTLKEETIVEEDKEVDTIIAENSPSMQPMMLSMNMLGASNEPVIDGRVTISGPTSVKAKEDYDVNISAPGASKIKVYIKDVMIDGTVYDFEEYDTYDGDSATVYGYSDRMSYESIYAVACFDDVWSSRSDTLTITVNSNGALPTPEILECPSEVNVGEYINVKISKGPGVKHLNVRADYIQGDDKIPVMIYHKIETNEYDIFRIDGDHVNKAGTLSIRIQSYPKDDNIHSGLAVRSINVIGDNVTVPEAPTFRLSDDNIYLTYSSMKLIFDDNDFEDIEIYHGSISPYTPTGGSRGHYYNKSEGTAEFTLSMKGLRHVFARGKKNGVWSDWSESKAYNVIGAYGVTNPLIADFRLKELSYTNTKAPVTVSWEQASFPEIPGYHSSYVVRWYGPEMPYFGKAFTTTNTSLSIPAEFTRQPDFYTVEVYAVMIDDAGQIAKDADGNAVQKLANGYNVVELKDSNLFLTTPVLSPDVVWIGDQAIISVVTTDQVAYLKSVNNNNYVSDEKFDAKAENGRITWTRPTRPESTDTGRTWTCIAYNAAGEEIGRSNPSNPITVYSKPTVVASPSVTKKGETITFTVFAPGKSGTVKLETVYNGTVYPVGDQQTLNANGQAAITHSFSSAGENREIRAYINGEYFGSVYVTINDEEKIEPVTEPEKEQEKEPENAQPADAENAPSYSDVTDITTVHFAGLDDATVIRYIANNTETEEEREKRLLTIYKRDTELMEQMVEVINTTPGFSEGDPLFFKLFIEDYFHIRTKDLGAWDNFWEDAKAIGTIAWKGLIQGMYRGVNFDIQDMDVIVKKDLLEFTLRDCLTLDTKKRQEVESQLWYESLLTDAQKTEIRNEFVDKHPDFKITEEILSGLYAIIVDQHNYEVYSNYLDAEKCAYIGKGYVYSDDPFLKALGNMLLEASKGNTQPLRDHIIYVCALPAIGDSASLILRGIAHHVNKGEQIAAATIDGLTRNLAQIHAIYEMAICRDMLMNSARKFNEAVKDLNNDKTRESFERYIGTYNSMTESCRLGESIMERYYGILSNSVAYYFQNDGRTIVKENVEKSESKIKKKQDAVYETNLKLDLEWWEN